MVLERWRVGSPTMGLVLILFGAVTLMSLMLEFSAVNILLTLWPLILICLGVEILLHLFVRKKDAGDVKLRYDVLSIMFIGFLLFLSTLFYTFTYASELYGSRAALAGELGIRSDTVFEKYNQELPGAEELTVFDGFYGKITVIPAAGNSISVDYDISVRTSDRAYAESLIGGLVGFETAENTAYMLSNTTGVSNDNRIAWPRVGCVVRLPAGKTLDLSQFYGDVSYDDSIKEQIKLNAGR